MHNGEYACASLQTFGTRPSVWTVHSRRAHCPAPAALGSHRCVLLAPDLFMFFTCVRRASFDRCETDEPALHVVVSRHHTATICAHCPAALGSHRCLPLAPDVFLFFTCVRRASFETDARPMPRSRRTARCSLPQRLIRLLTRRPPATASFSSPPPSLAPSGSAAGSPRSSPWLATGTRRLRSHSRMPTARSRRSASRSPTWRPPSSRSTKQRVRSVMIVSAYPYPLPRTLTESTLGGNTVSRRGQLVARSHREGSTRNRGGT